MFAGAGALPGQIGRLAETDYQPSQGGAEIGDMLCKIPRQGDDTRSHDFVIGQIVNHLDLSGIVAIHRGIVVWFCSIMGVDNLELDLHVAVEDTGQQFAQAVGETICQPVAGVGVLGADGESGGGIIEIEKFRIAHPGVEGSLGHLQLELSQSGLPGLLWFHGVFLDDFFSAFCGAPDKKLNGWNDFRQSPRSVSAGRSFGGIPA